ncbi:MAG: alpha/beta hydrolase family protein [Oscillospiraceae bacterium]|nr:alpha/beta hydrolase family protein [Oscillospiraceae bacterium]
MGLFGGDFYAHSLQMTTRIQVIFPEVSNDVTPVVEGEPRVLYLLHGLAANCGEWTRFSKIEYYAKKYNFIIIMPEVQRSFYCDSAYGPKYFTYIADELPAICAKWFCITQDPARTFIAGESMGGYGAVKAAMRRPKSYNAVATLSGVLDYPHIAREIIAGNWTDVAKSELCALHGASGLPAPEDDVLALMQAQAQNPNRPRLIQLCGTEDFLYQDNQTFRLQAQKAGYGHTYMEWQGDHEWPFWDVAIQRAIQFFLQLDMDTTPIY